MVTSPLRNGRRVPGLPRLDPRYYRPNPAPVPLPVKVGEVVVKIALLAAAFMLGLFMGLAV